MAKASDNLFPYVHLVPAAAPAAPAAGAERIYLDSGDGNKLKRKNSSGTVTTVEGGGGGTGEATWTAPTLSGAWVNYGGAFSTAGYRKDSNGVVHLRGVVKSGTIGTAIFTLPAGYRPSMDMIFPVISNSTIGQINVTASTGVVQCNIGNNASVTLDGITFYID